MQSTCLSYINNIPYDLITTYKFQHILEVINLRQICLHLEITSSDSQNLQKQLAFFSFLELITNQKPKSIKSKKIKVNFSFKGGIPIGCKVNLRKKEMYRFLDYFLVQILGYVSHTKKVKVCLFTNSYRLIINNLFSFTEIKKNYIVYATLNSLTIDFFFQSSLFSQQITFLNLLKLPL